MRNGYRDVAREITLKYSQRVVSLTPHASEEASAIESVRALVFSRTKDEGFVLAPTSLAPRVGVTKGC